MAPAPPQPPKPAPLPSSFSQAQAKKAVDALHGYARKTAAERDETELISKEEYVWLGINTKHPTTRKRLMPVRIQLPHPPLPPPPATSVCLITKDPQREYKDLLAAQNIKFVSRVVGVEKLKGKFKPYEARRNLMNEHEVWLADERVVPVLPGLLGKKFFEAKKTPIPVNLKKKDLKTELAKAISSAYYHPSTGTSHSIRIATISSSTPAQTLENLLTAVPQAIAQIQDQWANVLSVGIKTSASVFLPVWNAPLDGRFAMDTGADGAIREEDAEGDVVMGGERGKAGKAKAQAKTKGKAKATSTAEEAPAGGGSMLAVEGKGGEKKRMAPSADESVPAKKAALVVPPKEAVKMPKKMMAGVGKADLAAKKGGKKSSTIGTGGAGKRMKAGLVGRA